MNYTNAKIIEHFSTYYTSMCLILSMVLKQMNHNVKKRMSDTENLNEIYCNIIEMYEKNCNEISNSLLSSLIFNVQLLSTHLQPKIHKLVLK